MEGTPTNPGVLATVPLSVEFHSQALEELAGSKSSNHSSASNSQVAGTRKTVTARKRKPTKNKVPDSNPAMTGGVINVSKQINHGEDVMLEFDQFVLYHEMKKKTEEALSSQEQKISQDKFSSQERTQGTNGCRSCFRSLLK